GPAPGQDFPRMAQAWTRSPYMGSRKERAYPRFAALPASHRGQRDSSSLSPAAGGCQGAVRRARKNQASGPQVEVVHQGMGISYSFRSIAQGNG
ncbi:hypothetical protein J6590_108147, partial [Homalodisca vitripennis]